MPHPQKTLATLALLLTLLALCVVLLGAWTRLEDAGLGCPDWPGCYGQLSVPSTQQAIAHAEQLFPHAEPVSFKAWPEMIHRYIAGLLSLGLLTLLGLTIYWRQTTQQKLPLAVPILLIGMLFFQATLGMWTVTLLLLPLVVMGHLIGGITITALCYYLWLTYSMPLTCHTPTPAPPSKNHKTLKYALLLAIGLLGCQIILGGWTSANYASLICPDFPYCYGHFWPTMDFAQGFHLLAPLGKNYQGGHLATQARVAIQMVHRYGAIILTLYLICLISYSYAQLKHLRPIRLAIYAAVGCLGAQLILGYLNVAWQLPISIAMAHNGCAVLLTLSVITLWHRIHHLPPKGPSS
jgi:heme a synthase